MRALLAGLAAIALPACSSPGASGTGGTGGAGGSPDAGTPCVPAAVGMTIMADTVLCSGTLDAAVAPGDAAVVIGADGVTLACEGTVLAGMGFGSTGTPTVGIRVEGRSHVTVRGCTARGFGYGAVVKGGADVRLEGVHLDDNFTDPTADWTEDTVQGGGVRFEGTQGGALTGSTLARNWNAIEIRSASGLTVDGNTADHCSNAGALLVDAHDDTLTDNDLSWAVRGGLTFPDSWYGVDTKDSAGIIVDAGSSGVVLRKNKADHGGDGIFIRSVIGACPHDNVVDQNDASFSPHNAIECWCDGHTITGNDASKSDYGLWLGGSDRAVVRGNTVDGSVVDGISIQIAHDRHTLVEGNTVTNSGRAGILLSGRQYQATDPLTAWSPDVANSSHIVVQGNTLSGNAAHDVFVTSTRALVLASNCGPNGGALDVDLGMEAEVVEQVGSCGAAQGRTAPTAVLADPGPAQAGAPLALDASASTPGAPGDALGFTWLVQEAADTFANGVLPPLLLGVDGGPKQTVTVPGPGFYDVDVVAHDGHLGALAYRTLTVVPMGVRVGEKAADWTGACAMFPSCTTTFADDPAGVEGTSVHVTTDAPYDFAMTTPPGMDLHLDASQATTFGFFVKAQNTNMGGWQGNFPVVVLGGPGGTITYTPAANLLPTDPSSWIFVAVPLAGGGGFARTDQGGALSQVDYVQIHTDTWGGDAYDLWIDTATFY
jgi:parallel beta-helix repeat protein